MDDDVKYLIEKIRDDIKDLKKDNRSGHEKTEKHLVKTCNEIKEVSNKQTELKIQVTKLDSDLHNHLTTENEKKVTKRKRWVSRRELALLVIAVVGAAVGIVRIFY